MSGPDPTVEWGRAHRGRLWHLVRTRRVDTEGEAETTFCDLPHDLVEHTLGQPPYEGPVCDRCAEAVQELVDAIRSARDARWPLIAEPPVPAVAS